MNKQPLLPLNQEESSMIRSSAKCVIHNNKKENIGKYLLQHFL